jgi:hypothetical protein
MLPSFKSELTRCRVIVKQEPDGDRRTSDLETLDRWLSRHEDAEKHWETIQRTAKGPLAAHELIETVLERAYLSKRSIEVSAEAPRLEKRAVALARADFDEGRYSSAIVRQEKARHSETLSKRVLGHKPKFGARRNFMTFFSRTFVSTLGAPLDIVVAFLTEIALDEEVDATDVSDARKVDIRRQKKPGNVP